MKEDKEVVKSVKSDEVKLVPRKTIFDEALESFFGKRFMPFFYDPFGELSGETIFGDLSKNTLLPRINVEEKDNEYKVSIEAPGLNEKDVEITLSDGILTVKGQKEEKKEEKDEKGKYTYREFSSGSFLRQFSVPENTNAEDIAASSKDGIITITFPRKQLEAPKKEVKKIEVKASKE